MRRNGEVVPVVRKLMSSMFFQDSLFRVHRSLTGDQRQRICLARSKPHAFQEKLCFSGLGQG